MRLQLLAQPAIEERDAKKQVSRLVRSIMAACHAQSQNRKSNYRFSLEYSGRTNRIEVEAALKVDVKTALWNFHCWLEADNFLITWERIVAQLELILARIKHSSKLPTFEPVKPCAQ